MHDKTDLVHVPVGAQNLAKLSQTLRPHQPALRRFHELIGYMLAALAGLAADSAILVFLVDVAGISVLTAAALSFTAGALVVHALAVRIAFCRHKLKSRRVELVLFVAVGCGGLLVTLAVMAIGTQWLLLDYRLCKGAAAGGSFLFNYAARKALLF